VGKTFRGFAVKNRIKFVAFPILRVYYSGMKLYTRHFSPDPPTTPGTGTPPPEPPKPAVDTPPSTKAEKTPATIDKRIGDLEAQMSAAASEIANLKNEKKSGLSLPRPAFVVFPWDW
jgi:hypothetical protein